MSESHPDAPRPARARKPRARKPTPCEELHMPAHSQDITTDTKVRLNLQTAYKIMAAVLLAGVMGTAYYTKEYLDLKSSMQAQETGLKKAETRIEKLEWTLLNVTKLEEGMKTINEKVDKIDIKIEKNDAAVDYLSRQLDARSSKPNTSVQQQ